MSGPSNWLKRIVGRESRKPATTQGRRLFAVGDIHGRRDLLQRMLKKITAHKVESGFSNAIVFLGDYIDRGPDSKGVIDLLLALDLPGWQKVFLRGNHDQAILDFLRDPLFYRAWRGFGAPETLLSYGVIPPRFDSEDAFVKARNELSVALPQAHLHFLERLDYSFTDGDYHFVHAGVRPGIALERQVAEDMLWIRDDFLLSTRDFGKVVVHGHTPTEKPVKRFNRIGLDTGAHATGCLTAAVFEGESCDFLSTLEKQLIS